MSDAPRVMPEVSEGDRIQELEARILDLRFKAKGDEVLLRSLRAQREELLREIGVLKQRIANLEEDRHL